MSRAHTLIALLLLALCGRARAQVAEPSPRDDDAFDVMNLLAGKQLHSLHDERWNVYGQATHISSFKLPFAAPYSNANGTPNSLLPGFEHSFTTTATLYAALRLWRGGELFGSPELIAMRPLSELKGLGSTIQNFELQKNGTATPLVYLSRAYFRQTFDVGGAVVEQPSDPLQLGRTVRARRFTLTLGKFSVVDAFDKNAYAGDLRRQFFNMAFMSYAAFDFAADARGYAVGGVLEYTHDDWAVRVGRFTPPKQPNQLPLDYRLHKHYGDQLELEHHHRIGAREGAVRVLGFRNRERMGRFRDALSAVRDDPEKNAAACPYVLDGYASQNAAAPDLCWVRKAQVKWGVGVNLEQDLGAGFGLFLRGMVADGRTEVYSFTSTDRSLALGVLAKGLLWGRPSDLVGVGHADGFISRSHARYLAAGGLDGFIGDGRLRAGAESVTEVFYALALVSDLWVSADWQLIAHPGYNRDRGPVSVLGLRVHGEI